MKLWAVAFVSIGLAAGYLAKGTPPLSMTWHYAGDTLTHLEVECGGQRFFEPAEVTGENAWLHRRDVLLDAIRAAEGVPTYGLRARSALRPGETEEGARAEASALVGAIYDAWVEGGGQGDFLLYLRDRWAPIGARNDPNGLNAYWLGNVRSYLERNWWD